MQVIHNVSESIALKLLEDCTIATTCLEGDTVAMLFSNLSGSLFDLAVRAACPSIDSDATVSVSVRNTQSAVCVASILPRLQKVKSLEFQIDCVRHCQQEAAHSLRPRHCKELLHSTRQLPRLVNLSVTISVPVASVLRNWRRLLARAIYGLPYLQRLEVTMTPIPVYNQQVFYSSASSGVKMLTRAIGRLPELTSLKMIGTLLSRQTAPEAIRKITSLQALHLSDRLLTQAPLSQMVCAAPHLTRLSLSEGQGQWFIEEPDPYPVRLVRMRSAFNPIASAVNPVASAIGRLAHLQVLQVTADMPPQYLPSQCTTDALPNPLTKCAQLSRIELVQITQCRSLPQLLCTFRQLPNLQHLRIEVHHVVYGRCTYKSPRCHKLAPRIFEELARLQQLTCLRLCGVAMQQSDRSVMGMVNALAELKKLHKLHIRQIWMGDSVDCRAVSKFVRLIHSSVSGQCAIEFTCNLEFFSLTSTPDATDNGVSVFNLMHVHLPACGSYNIGVIANTLNLQKGLVHVSLCLPGGSANAHRRAELLAAIAAQRQLTRLELAYTDPGLDDAALEQASEILASPLNMLCEEELHDRNHVGGAGGDQCALPERPWMGAGNGRHAAQGLAQLEVLDMSGCYVTKALTSLDPLLPLLVVLPSLQEFVRPGRQWQRGAHAAADLAWRQNVMRARQGLKITDRSHCSPTMCRGWQVHTFWPRPFGRSVASAVQLVWPS